MQNNPSQIIRTANLAWETLYFEELHNEENYQLSLVKRANRDYFNCAHDLKKLDHKILKKIETYFYNNNLPSAIYIEPQSQNDYIPMLKKTGYVLILEEQENWYEFNMPNLTGCNPIEFDDKIKYQCIDPREKSHEFQQFLNINQIVNNIPNHLIEQMNNKALRPSQYPDVTTLYYLGYWQDIPVSTQTLSIIGTIAFFAEGATLPEFRRRGVYSYLTHTILRNISFKGVKTVYINCDHDAFSNQAALKLGFQFIFQRDFYKKIRSKNANHQH